MRNFIAQVGASVVSGILLYFLLLLWKKLFDKTKEKLELPTQKVELSGHDRLQANIIITFICAIILIIFYQTAISINKAMMLLGASFFFVLAFQVIYQIFNILRAKAKHEFFSQTHETAFFIIFLMAIAWIINVIVPRYVDFDYPDQLNSPELLRGRVCNSDWHIRVLVHPLAGGDSWYVQETPVPDGDGKWEIKCHFGGGVGSQYLVLALASPADFQFGLGRVLTSAEIPNDVYKSNIKKVVESG